MKKEYNRENKFHTPWSITENGLNCTINDCDGDFILATSYRDIAEHIVAVAAHSANTRPASEGER